jgi:hypothetical protein
MHGPVIKPLDGLPQALFERDFGLPAQHPPGLVGVEDTAEQVAVAAGSLDRLWEGPAANFR